MRVIDLFREWDEDGDGVVTKKDVRRALRRLQGGGLVPLQDGRLDVAAEKLFSLCSRRGEEGLHFKELNRVLKRKVVMPRLAGREPVRLDECTERYERGARTKEHRAEVSRANPNSNPT